MASPDDLEGYLSRLDRRFEKVGEQTYLVSLGPEKPPLGVRIAAPVVVFQVDVGAVPASAAPAVEARLYRRLLELNASDLVHVAYGIEDGHIVLDAAMDLDSLDFREVEAVLADVDLAVAKHVPDLRRMARAT
jgi:hypothetical protein